MTTSPEIDQVWQDNDKRGYGRKVRVVELDSTHATVELVTARQVQALSGPQTTAQPGRRTRIRLDRFKPTSTGYRLIRNADGSPAPAPDAASEGE